MNKILKYVLLGLLILFVLVAGVASYFLATFNPNEYKPQIIQMVKDKQNRSLKLDGDITFTLFPSLGVKIDKVSLSEFNDTKEFASIDNARFALSLLPLLSKQIVVSEVGLSGVQVSIVKFKNGSSNLDDLMSKKEAVESDQPTSEPGPNAAFRFDIASIKIEKTELSYRDEMTGAKYFLKDLNFKSGRIANGIPVKMNFDTLIQSNKPKLDIATELNATITFDLENDLYEVEGLEFLLKGAVLDIENLILKANGNASANLETQEFKAKKLDVSASGVKDKNNFNLDINLPDLNFNNDKVTSNKLTVSGNLEGDFGKLIASISLQELQGNMQSFKSGGLMLDAELKQPEQQLKLKISTPLAGSLDAQQLNLSSLVVAVSATGDKLPNKSINSEMKGSLQVDGGRESVQLNLAGGLLQSQVKTKLALKGFSEPAIRFDLEVDQFDADLYLPKKSAEETAKAKSAPEKEFDLSGLKKLNLEGGLRIGSLKVANVKSTKLRVDVKAHNGQVNINPLSANLYEGSINGSVAVNAAQVPPTFVVKETMIDVQLGQLLKDALDLDMVAGKGNVSSNVTTEGNTITALKKELAGVASVNLVDGEIKGVNLSKLVHAAQNIGQAGGVQTLKPSDGDKTEFSELKASFKINKGVAHNDDLLVKSQSLRVTGGGDVDIGNSSVSYMAKATVAEAVDSKNGSMTIPVQLNGPFTDLKFKVDYAAVIKDVVKQKLDTKVEQKKDELKQQLEEKLKGGLKGLFK